MADAFDGKTILIVDDDQDIVTSIEACLDETSATVESANDGNKAVAMAEKLKPDLVILDIMLPRKSGFLVLEALRKGKKATDKPYVIMITGNQGQRHRQYAEALGVHEYLNKPFAMERLLDAAGSLLAEKE